MSLGWLLSLVAPPLCVACGGPVAGGDPLCPDCRLRLCWLGPELVEAGGVPLWAPLAYDRGARSIVATVKYHGAEGLVETMAAQIAANAPEGVLAGGQLVPVPMHPARRRRRGFNQAELLARALARRTGLTVDACLERRGTQRPQVGRGRSERLRGVPGSVAPRTGTAVPREAVLVDDVVTTGATLAACAAALRAAGATSVAAVAYARTPGR